MLSLITPVEKVIVTSLVTWFSDTPSPKRLSQRGYVRVMCHTGGQTRPREGEDMTEGKGVGTGKIGREWGRKEGTERWGRNSGVGYWQGGEGVGMGRWERDGERDDGKERKESGKMGDGVGS